MSERFDQFYEMFKPLKCTTESFRDWLVDEGFFVKPASIKYHGNYDGGLFDHSMAVTNILLWLTKSLDLEWQDGRSPYVIGMFHDICKLDRYIRDGDFWKYADEELLPGHGEKSVILLQQHFGSLTDEEILCIRWHMGFADEKENWNKYGASIEHYPNVLYTHTADMIAARILGT